MNVFAKKMENKLALLTQITDVYAGRLILKLVSKKNAKLFCRRLVKIAENSDHNIGPRSVLFPPQIQSCFKVVSAEKSPFLAAADLHRRTRSLTAASTQLKVT
jgi:hypothetical protein